MRPPDMMTPNKSTPDYCTTAGDGGSRRSTRRSVKVAATLAMIVTATYVVVADSRRAP